LTSKAVLKNVFFGKINKTLKTTSQLDSLWKLTKIVKQRLTLAKGETRLNHKMTLISTDKNANVLADDLQDYSDIYQPFDKSVNCYLHG